MTDEATNADQKPPGDGKPDETAFNKAVDEAAARKIAEEAAKKPPDPKYEPPPDNIKRQAEYLKRDMEKGGKALDQLMGELAKDGIVQEAAGDSPELLARLDRQERDNARLRAGIKYQLSEDDIAIIDGSPDEIDRKAKYMRERIDTVVAKAKDDPKEGDEPGGKKPETKPSAPSFEKYRTQASDPKAAIAQAEADMAESIAEGGKIGPAFKD